MFQKIAKHRANDVHRPPLVEPNVHELDVCTKDYIDIGIFISNEASKGKVINPE